MKDISTDPHPQWLADWYKARDTVETASEGPEEHRERQAVDEVHSLGVLLASTPATSCAGLAAQIKWFDEDLGYYTKENVTPALRGIFETLVQGVKNIGQ